MGLARTRDAIGEYGGVGAAPDLGDKLGDFVLVEVLLSRLGVVAAREGEGVGGALDGTGDGDGGRGDFDDLIELVLVREGRAEAADDLQQARLGS